jgi:hypothetical protein
VNGAMWLEQANRTPFDEKNKMPLGANANLGGA